MYVYQERALNAKTNQASLLRESVQNLEESVFKHSSIIIL